VDSRKKSIDCALELVPGEVVFPLGDGLGNGFYTKANQESVEEEVR
jgi:hypothetical protein